MKYGIFLTLFSAAALLVAGKLSPVFAQDYDPAYAPEYASSDRDWNPSGSDYDQGPARHWERFLERDENQDFARQFSGNPNIVRDPREMDQWSGVRELFDNHPDVRDYVYQTVRDYNENTQPGEKWHRELEANPNFANRYRQNPNIVNDSNLASDEPEIGEFLRTNPEVRPYLDRKSDRYDRDLRNED